MQVLAALLRLFASTSPPPKKILRGKITIIDMNSDKIILDLCGGTGSWSKPYKDAGYDVRLITLPLFNVTDPYVIEQCIALKP